MSSEIKIPNSNPPKSHSKKKHLNRLKIIGAVLTAFGIGLFAYLVHSVGISTILEGISKIGFGGFAIIVFIFFLRIVLRAFAWKLSVSAPYQLGLKDTIPAVIIGEAMSSLLPLGILVSGTAKAVAVRNRVPLVVGLSSVATENLFYSFITATFIIFGAVAFLRTFELDANWVLGIDIVIGVLIFLLILGILMVLRQWRFASSICEKIYQKGYLTGILEDGRKQVRLFEDFIYGFYRKHPNRFFPIFLCQVLYHLLGIVEVWFILSRLSEIIQPISTAFLLESVSRLITIVFKLIPFVIGVDEAGAQFVTETLAIGAGIGITLAIIRKGRILFWTAMGLLLIIKREISFAEITGEAERSGEEENGRRD
ncbi:MAG TPA: lysylphosphatidylglycerol synthase transmembrane domain-containing protein [Pyrinomonadaceae bacterium]|nr:lysylphosphatidylglycerol synthase transmembrane domain-containing protein [Pyrinomonadaceae bacterium]